MLLSRHSTTTRTQRAQSRRSSSSSTMYQAAFPRALYPSKTTAAVAASASQLVGLLGSNTVLDALQTAGIQGVRLVATRQEPVPSSTPAIKTMVLVCEDVSAQLPATTTPTAPQQPAAVAVLLLAGHKVSLRAVAQHLGLPRGSLRLATADEAVASTGYELGAIPPLGHMNQLQTLVDVHVAQLPPQQLVCAGGGAADTQLVLSVEQLVAATAGQIGSFSSTPPSPSAQQQPAAAASSSQHNGQELKQQQQPPAVQLPQPWARGQGEVELVGVLAQRRRIAKLLLFATLVPESVPALPSDGTASYIRRLWSHPDSGLPCEVQLIMGKTIERQLGRDGAAALFDKLKVGAVVALSGRVQQHPQPAAGADPGRHRHVIDVVVSEIRVLHKSRDTLSRAVLAAQRRGHTAVRTALDLEQLQLGTSTQAAAAAAAGPDDVSSVPPAAAAGGATGSAQLQPALNASSSSAAAVNVLRRGSTTAAAAPAPAASRTQASGQQQPSGPQQQPQQSAGKETAYYQSPLAPQQIRLVQTLSDILHMQQAVLNQVPHAPEVAGAHGSTTSNSSSSSSSSFVPIVSLDCEWQPYGRGAPKTPVALLQLATRQQVFIIDMLAICQQRHSRPGSSAAGVSSSSSSSSVGSQDDVCEPALTSAEEALGQFLQQLFSTSHIRVVGFGLLGDVLRLAKSYPWLLAARFTSSSSSESGEDDWPSSSSSSAKGRSRQISMQAAPGAVQTLLVSAESAVALPSSATAVVASPVDGWVVRQAVELQQLADARNRQVSLSALVNRTLGKPLDKAQQASNWAARPLAAEQLLYAATDAHVLTVLHDELLAKVAVS